MIKNRFYLGTKPGTDGTFTMFPRANDGSHELETPFFVQAFPSICSERTQSPTRHQTQGDNAR
jgi:hypothetical protein